MTTADINEADFEVIRDGDGWGVLRAGEPQPISHHETRAEAEAAARLHADQGFEVDARKDPFSGDGPEAASARHTFATIATYAAAVVVLLVVISLIVALG